MHLPDNIRFLNQAWFLQHHKSTAIQHDGLLVDFSAFREQREQQTISTILSSFSIPPEIIAAITPQTITLAKTFTDIAPSLQRDIYNIALAMNVLEMVLYVRASQFVQESTMISREHPVSGQHCGDETYQDINPSQTKSRTPLAITTISSFDQPSGIKRTVTAISRCGVVVAANHSIMDTQGNHMITNAHYMQTTPMEGRDISNVEQFWVLTMNRFAQDPRGPVPTKKVLTYTPK